MYVVRTCVETVTLPLITITAKKMLGDVFASSFPTFCFSFQNGMDGRLVIIRKVSREAAGDKSSLQELPYPYPRESLNNHD